ncbi:Abi family protein [Nocardia sp. NPDC058705]|uniref:Abi family protein n=1 Tax=Nocardia sp. NPDC058705 TaxID=3346609 RepID=UPI00368A8B38
MDDRPCSSILAGGPEIGTQPLVTSYAKPYKTLPEQVALLRHRGMTINDEAAATAQLLAIGYYRLSGYCYTFREHAVPCATTCNCPRRSDNFVPGASLEKVVELYEFDRMLRLLVLDGIERVEVALRMRLGYVVGAGGAFAHLDPVALDPAFTRFDGDRPLASGPHWLNSEHAKWLSKVTSEADRSKEDFVAHFKAKYGMPLPIWVVTELLTFGSLVTLIGGLKPRHRSLIAETFGIFDPDCDGDGAALASWMSNLNYIRNVCAHHGRLWNRNIAVQLGRLDTAPELIHASGPRPKSRVYASLALLAFLTARIDTASTWRSRVIDLVTGEFADLGLPVGQMGFPSGWQNEGIWAAGYLPPADPVDPEHREVLRHFECVGTAAAGICLDVSSEAKRRSSAVRFLRSRNQLLGLPVGKSRRFPTFQFDTDPGGLHPEVGRINSALEAEKRPWDAARWWINANPGVDGAVPMTLLGSSGDRVRLLAATITVDDEAGTRRMRVDELPQP